MTRVLLPEAVAEELVFLTVTVQGPLPISRVVLPLNEVCVVVEHLMVMSWELESLLVSFTAKAAGVARPRAKITDRVFIALEFSGGNGA